VQYLTISLSLQIYPFLRCILVRNITFTEIFTYPSSSKISHILSCTWLKSILNLSFKLSLRCNATIHTFRMVKVNKQYWMSRDNPFMRNNSWKKRLDLRTNNSWILNYDSQSKSMLHCLFGSSSPKILLISFHKRRIHSTERRDETFFFHKVKIMTMANKIFWFNYYPPYKLASCFLFFF